MKNFVFWTGMLDMVAGIGLQVHPVSARAFPSETQSIAMHLFGLVTIFLGAMLLLCSRDLQRRGPLVAWEGVLRLGGFAIMAGYGVFGGAGISTALCGVVDLSIGVVYLIGLPRILQVPLSQLLLDVQK